jgi:hypothetical protein
MQFSAVDLATRIRDEFSAWTLGRRGVTWVFDPFLECSLYSFCFLFPLGLSCQSCSHHWQVLVTIALSSIKGWYALAYSQKKKCFQSYWLAIVKSSSGALLCLLNCADQAPTCLHSGRK